MFALTIVTLVAVSLMLLVFLFAFSVSDKDEGDLIALLLVGIPTILAIVTLSLHL